MPSGMWGCVVWWVVSYVLRYPSAVISRVKQYKKSGLNFEQTINELTSLSVCFLTSLHIFLRIIFYTCLFVSLQIFSRDFTRISAHLITSLYLTNLLAYFYLIYQLKAYSSSIIEAYCHNAIQPDKVVANEGLEDIYNLWLEVIASSWSWSWTKERRPAWLLVGGKVVPVNVTRISHVNIMKYNQLVV